MTDFDDCLSITLREEGGFVDDPQDSGGMTNLGVTRRVWEAWTHQPASEADMRALTSAAVAPLYRAQYWNAVVGDQLPSGIDLCVFDFAVNGGVSRAARTLQACVGAVQDGHIGPATLAAVAGHAGLIDAYQNAREAFYRGLPTFAHFGNGWTARTERIRARAKGLAG
jgi:lysozyme family protein